MSTKPVAAKADAAIAALSALSDDANKAVKTAEETVDKAGKTIDQVVHGAQVAVQHKKDEIEAAQHIIAQLSSRTATPPVEPPAPAADSTPAPTESPAPTPIPPTVPITPVPNAAPAANDPTDLGLPAPTVPPQRRSSWVIFHSFGWDRIAWLLAMLFGFVTLLIALLSYDGIFPTKPDMLRVLLVILLTAFTFFIGGSIGSAVDRRTTVVTTTDAPEATPPVPPVPPVAS